MSLYFILYTPKPFLRCNRLNFLIYIAIVSNQLSVSSVANLQESCLVQGMRKLFILSNRYIVQCSRRLQCINIQGSSVHLQHPAKGGA